MEIFEGVLNFLNGYWGFIVSIAAIISASVKLILDLLRIREVRLRNRFLLGQLRKQERMFEIANAEEIEKYGNQQDRMGQTLQGLRTTDPYEFYIRTAMIGVWISLAVLVIAAIFLIWNISHR